MPLIAILRGLTPPEAVPVGRALMAASRPQSTHFALATSSFDETVRQLADFGVALQDLSGMTGQAAATSRASLRGWIEPMIRIPCEGLGLDSCAFAKRVGW